MSSGYKSSFPVKSAFEITIFFLNLLIEKYLINSFLLRCNRPTDSKTRNVQFPPFHPNISRGFLYYDGKPYAKDGALISEISGISASVENSGVPPF